MALPARMTAIAIRAPGGPEMLVSEERPVPVPGAGEILPDLVHDLFLRAVVVVDGRHRSPPRRSPENSGLGGGCHTPGR